MKHLCAIVCQETAYKWIPWIGRHPVRTIVERAVYDASGDYPGTSRRPFPVNTAAFRARYGSAATDMLIEEANKTLRNIRSIYVKEFEAKVEDGKITAYRVNVKISFALEA